jgi:hypothetical protein
MVEPVGGGAHRLRLQPAGDGAARLLARDEAGVREHVEVLHHRRQRHGEGPGAAPVKPGADISILLRIARQEESMNPTSIAAAMSGAQSAGAQMVLAAKMVRMNADAQGAIAQVIDAAAQNAQRLADTAAGVGRNVDISA